MSGDDDVENEYMDIEIDQNVEDKSDSDSESSHDNCDETGED